MNGSVEPIARSTLSQTVPSVSQGNLVNALPEPADFGPGWVFDTESVDDHDYFELVTGGAVGDACEGADPARVGLPVMSPHKITATMKREDGPSSVEMGIGVDSPAASSDRITFLRAVYEQCGKVEREGTDEKFTVEHEILKVPGVKADQTLAVRVTTEREKDGDKKKTVSTRAYARVGGLVVGLLGFDGADPRPHLAAALAEARRELRL
ncbi:MAG: hypothetical protein ACRDNL_15015 [Spirillospora sp.]